MTQAVEKRKFRRVKSKFDVKIKIQGEGEKKYNVKVGRSKDLSAGGILMKYDRELQIGEIVHVTFLKPNSFEFFEGSAKVVRTEFNPDDKTYDIGVQFINLTADDEKKLEKCLLKIK